MTNKKLSGLLGLAMKAGKVVFGTEACITDINKKKVKLLIVAEDAADRTKTNFRNLCKDNEIPIYEVLKIEEISQAIGKDNKAVIGIKDVNFSKAMIEIINGGEIIG